jgi:hypothetical protein
MGKAVQREAVSSYPLSEKLGQVARVTVPLRDFISINAVTSECIPRESAGPAMILVRVVKVMRENEMGIATRWPV